MIPQLKAISDVNIAGNIISVGALLPYSCLNIAMVVETMCKEAVLITTKRTILLFAESVLGDNSFKRFIAFNPSGVAALSRPSRFAVIFIAIASSASLSFKEGKRNFKKGKSNLHNFLVNPLFSAMCIIPFQKQIIPISFIASVTAEEPLDSTAEERLFIFLVAIAEKKEKIIIITQI